jgi:hypothetical protein
VTPGKLAVGWSDRDRIGRLFDERDDAVHFNAETVDAVWDPHHDSHVDPTVLRYGTGAATTAVDLVLEVLVAWAEHPNTHTKKWAHDYGDRVGEIRNRR